MVHDIEEFIKLLKRHRRQQLREALGADVCLMLDSEPRPHTLMDYLPQGQLVLRSGYTTQPGATTSIVEVEVQDAS